MHSTKCKIYKGVSSEKLSILPTLAFHQYVDPFPRDNYCYQF